MTTTVNERLLDLYFERAIDLIRLEAGTRRKVLALLQDLESEIVATIAKTNPDHKRLKKLLKAVQAAITASYRGVNVLMAEEIRELIDVEATWTARAINSAMQIEFLDAGLTRRQLSTLVSEVLIQGAPTKDWWARQAGGLAERFADEMRRGVALGENNAKLIDRVRGKSGLMNIAESSASRLVRSSVQTAANVGREAVYAENNDIISAIQWSSTLDTRTSEWCLVRDGKLYSPIGHKPVDHDVPWLEGPGKLHWNALVAGTMVRTTRGVTPIESITIGDRVLTHNRRWKSVTACRSKALQDNVVRVIHTQSGRVLRATDDHPVRLASGQWVFVGALEVGDQLLCDSESVPEIMRMSRVLNSESKNCPSLFDESEVARKRTLQLMTPDIDFESDSEIGYREIENRCAELILANPSIIERDQSVAHHLFATAHILQKYRCERLSNLLASFNGDFATNHPISNFFVKPSSHFGFKCAFSYSRHMARILFRHASRMFSVFWMGFFRVTPSPMSRAGRSSSSSGTKIDHGLFLFGADNQAVSLGEKRKRSVRDMMFSFKRSKRTPKREVIKGDQCSFVHDPIIALEVLTVNTRVYDLEVEDDCSYLANDLVVSNCRSTSVPVLKTWRELGIDEDEIPKTTRASMDGQVAQDTTFESWLKRQSIERQEASLGKEKAALWRAGKITLRDLLDQDGRPLTLEQLKARL